MLVHSMVTYRNVVDDDHTARSEERMHVLPERRHDLVLRQYVLARVCDAHITQVIRHGIPKEVLRAVHEYDELEVYCLKWLSGSPSSELADFTC